MCTLYIGSIINMNQAHIYTKIAIKTPIKHRVDLGVEWDGSKLLSLVFIKSMFTRPSHVLLGSATQCLRRPWLKPPMSRSMSTTSNKVECYISKINDPYINLSIEEWLLRDTDPEKYILYLWRNRPCVVIGRNQNPFLECNLGFMQEHNIPLVRRRSGGGAVYHVSDGFIV